MHSKTIISALCLCLVNTATHAVSITGQGTWENTLHGRDLDGNLSTFEAYYDTSLNITWLADANYAGTTMNWSTANNWAANLNPYGSGITGWRLPTTAPIDGTTADDWSGYSYNGSEDEGYNISAPGTAYAGSTASELAHLYYNTLGNKGALSISGSSQVFRPVNTGLFSNIQPGNYWSETEVVPNIFGDTSHAWVFNMDGGQQGHSVFTKSDPLYVWAVHLGDVGVALPASTVPIPAAAWLFGSGLLSLITFAIKKRA